MKKEVLLPLKKHPFTREIAENICRITLTWRYGSFYEFPLNYSRLSISRNRRDPLKHFEISILRHIRFAELRKITIEQPNFTNEHAI